MNADAGFRSVALLPDREAADSAKANPERTHLLFGSKNEVIFTLPTVR